MRDVTITTPSSGNVLTYDGTKWVNSDPVIPDAEGIDYDNTDSGLTATNVQSAIDEVASFITIKTTTFTGTTLSNGTIATPDNVIPIGGRIIGDEGMILPGYSDRNSSDINYVKVTNLSGTAIQEATVNIQLFYIDIS